MAPRLKNNGESPGPPARPITVDTIAGGPRVLWVIGVIWGLYIIMENKTETTI